MRRPDAVSFSCLASQRSHPQLSLVFDVTAQAKDANMVPTKDVYLDPVLLNSGGQMLVCVKLLAL